jgi:osmoprotectant transport system ATP-binding protein
MATQGVEFANVSFTLEGGRQLLSDVSVRVEAGSTTALLGRSGSGKTTLLRMVNALVRPTAGCVLVGGKDVAGVNEIELRRGIGYVIQETGLFPHMTISENVGLPLDLGRKLPRGMDEYWERVEAALEKVGLPLRQFGDRYPWQLSGGQKQRAGVARALVNDPAVLLMDEPFGALDPLTRAEMQTMLRELLRRVGVTTLIVTHDLDEALYLADRVVLLEAGRVVADLAAGDVRASEIEAVRGYVAATHRTHVPETGHGAPDSAVIPL